MKKKRIYISGPISGRDLEQCRQDFQATETFLREQGHDPFNPMKNGLPADVSTHEHMHRDLCVLTSESQPFDAIFMKRGWLHSAGCKLEFDVATSIGLLVIFDDGNMTCVEFQ